MRVDLIQALAFGPLVGEGLALAPGMTVVHGPNEAAKTSWHAALQAGVCGRRRARGPAQAPERRFEERHRPWEGESWAVRAILRLEDGRRIELHQDLDRGTGTARDVDLGRDVLAELDLFNDGAPDGARLVGLDRRSFVATACVQQAQLHAVADDPDGLQQLLQRAAATAGAADTAAAAVRRLQEFRRDHVGSDKRTAVKPLRRALNEFETATSEYDGAVAAHAAHRELAQQADEAGRAAASAAREARAQRAGMAAARADDADTRLARAVALAARHQGPPPDDADDGAATRALAAWDARPSSPELEGPTAAELAAQLAALPAPPEGDLEPAAAVEAAWSELATAQTLVARHLAAEPASESPPSDLFARQQRVAHAEASVERERGATHPGLAIAGGALLIVGLALAVLGVLMAAVPAVIAGAAAIGVGLARGRAPGLDNALEEQRRAQLALAEAEHTQRERDRNRAEWERERDARLAAVKVARIALGAALAARGAPREGSPDEAVAAYRDACRRRRGLAEEAAQAEHLGQRLAARRSAEEQAAAARAARAAAALAVLEAARSRGLENEDAAAAVAALQAHQERRAEAARERDRALVEWHELRSLLGDGSLDDLRAAVRHEKERAGELALGLSATDLAGARARQGAAHPDDDAEARARRLADDASRLRGELDAVAQSVPDVAAAGERLAAARTALAELRQLDHTLLSTERFLDEAQTRVHRSIAPQLRQLLEERLDEVTAGRYTEATVDPRSLAVELRDANGMWRPARLLSHGTAEQVYLLLRLALVRLLEREGEPCPLLLDEITVQADGERTRRVLDVLHELSVERQVIVFTQEDEVLSWARDRLGGPADAIVELAPLRAAV